MQSKQSNTTLLPALRATHMRMSKSETRKIMESVGTGTTFFKSTVKTEQDKLMSPKTKMILEVNEQDKQNSHIPPILQKQLYALKGKRSQLSMNESTLSLVTNNMRKSLTNTSNDVSYLYNDKLKLSQSIGSPTVIYNSNPLAKFSKIKDSIYQKISTYELGQDFDLSLTSLKKKTYSFQTNTVKMIETNQIFQDPQQRDSKLEQSIVSISAPSVVPRSDKVPPSRLEVQELHQWLNMMLQQIQEEKSGKTLQSIVENVQLVYATTLKELIRQVSIECNDRGNLLQQVWEHYINLLDQIVNSHYENTKHVETESLAEITRLHKSYGSMEELQRKQYSELRSEYDILKASNDQFVSTNSYLKSKLLSLSQELKQLHMELDDVKLENSDLLKRLMNIKQAEEAGEDVLSEETKEEGSIVQHILQFRDQVLLKEVPSIQFNHPTSVQIFEKLQEQQSVLHQELNQLGFEVQPPTQQIPPSPGKKRKSAFFQDIQIMEQQTQTDPMDFSGIPLINNLIHDLSDLKEIIKSFDTNQRDMYEQGISKIVTNDNIDIADKQDLVQTINSANVQLTVFDQLKTTLTDLTDQFRQQQKGALTNYVELREAKEQIKELQDQIENVTEDFNVVLTSKNTKILQLKTINSKLQRQLDKMRSVNEEDKQQQFNLRILSNADTPTVSESKRVHLIGQIEINSDEKYENIQLNSVDRQLLDSRHDVIENSRPVRKVTESLEVNLQKKFMTEKVNKYNDNGPVSRRSSVQFADQTQSQTEKQSQQLRKSIVVKNSNSQSQQPEQTREYSQSQSSYKTQQNRIQTNQDSQSQEQSSQFIQRSALVQLQQLPPTTSAQSIMVNENIHISDQDSEQRQQQLPKKYTNTKGLPMVKSEYLKERRSSTESLQRQILNQQQRLYPNEEGKDDTDEQNVQNSQDQYQNQDQEYMRNKTSLDDKSQSNVVRYVELQEQIGELQDHLEAVTDDFQNIIEQKNLKINKLRRTNTKLKVQLKRMMTIQLDQSDPQQNGNDDMGEEGYKTQDFEKRQRSADLRQNQNITDEVDKEREELTLENGQVREDEDYVIGDEPNTPKKDVDEISVSVSRSSEEEDEIASPALASPNTMKNAGERVSKLLKEYQLRRRNVLRKSEVGRIRVLEIQKLNVVQPIPKRIKRVYSQNTEAAGQLLMEAKMKRQNQKDMINLQQIIKMIGMVLQEALKNDENYKIPFHVGVYDFFLNKYGFKQVAEKKIKQVYSFIVNHKSDSLKMQIIAQLCGIEDKIDEISYKLYLESQKYFGNKDINVRGLDALIPIDLVNDYVNIYLPNWLDPQHIQQLNLFLKPNAPATATVTNVFKLTNKVQTEPQFIDYDALMQKVLKLYFYKKEDQENSLKLLFEASDLDGDRLLGFYEFKLIYRELESSTFDKPKALNQFIQYADYIDESTKDKRITLARFAELSIEQGLFNKSRIQKYCHNSKQLFQLWDQEKDIIKYRFIEGKKYKMVKAALKLVDEWVQSNTEDLADQTEMQTMFISFRLLQSESKRQILRLRTKQILNSVLPVEVLMISQVFKVFDEFTI